MTALLLTEWFGTFRLEDGRVTAQTLFPRDPRAIAEKLKAMQAGEVLPEERELAAAGPLTVTEDRLLQIPGARLARDAKLPAAPRAQDYNFTVPLLHDASIQLGKLAVKEASGGRDKHVVMAVETIDDLLEASNLLTERLREWYALHAPEIVSKVDRPEELAGLVSAHGTREAILRARPDLPQTESMGADLSEDDLASLRAFARSVSHLYSSKAEIEKYLDKAMPDVAPNLTALLGAILAARFIRTAGGLTRLARMPAGTIQTLGAEKALFRHIKEGKKPPKHGLLFQHLALHRAPRHQRGTLARALAAKVAIAARADAFTKADLRATLVADWEKRESIVKREHAKARRGRERPTVPGGDRGFRAATRGPPRGGERPERGGFREERGPPRGDRPFQRGPPRGERPQYDRGPRPERGPPPQRAGDRPYRGDRPYGGPGGDRPQYGGGPPRGDRPYGDRPQGPPGGGYRGDRPPREDRGPRDERGPPRGGGGKFGGKPRRDFRRGPE